MIQRPIQSICRRRGAVLILVIVLLVLMALMGIAYMASARTDRAASAQNIINTQIELLLDGARAIANADIETDVAPTGDTFRPMDRGAMAGKYKHRDSIVETGRDLHLGARAPLSLIELAVDVAHESAIPAGNIVRDGADFRARGNGTPLTAPDGSPLGGDAIAWPALTRAGSKPFQVFIDVDPGDQSVRMFSNGALRIGPRGTGNPSQIDGRRPAFPTEVLVGGTIMPGLRLYDDAGLPVDLVATDTDGDGIADALPIDINFEQNGVKYLTALRIIDNNSAINLNTAGRREENLAANRQSWDLFPGNIDLEGLLNPDDDLDNLRAHIAGGSLPATDQMIDETRAPIPAFIYRSIADFAWAHTGRRVDNPGYTLAPVPGAGPLPASDTAALARRFVLADDPQLAVADRLIPRTLGAADTRLLVPYNTGEVKRWFDDHFNTLTAPSLRGLAVTRNPVSNATVAKSYWEPNLPPKEYPFLQPADDPPSDADPGNDNLQVMPPYQIISVKADVNTADFPTLWQAYWSVMAENPRDSYPASRLYDPAATGTPDGAGRIFRDVDRVDRSAYQDDPNLTPDQRALATVGVNVPGVVLLRAALAAVNTIDMRDVDDEVTVVEFEQKASAQGGNRRFRIYGYEAQPFLTECVIYKNFQTQDETQADGTIRRTVDYHKHVVAVELFNPYGRALNIGDYALALIDRHIEWPRKLNPLMAEADWNSAVRTALGIGPTDPIMMAAGQRLVLYNDEDERGDPLPEAADLLSSLPAGTVTVRVPDLGDAVGQELVIVRPRKPGELQADERLAGAAGLANRVPVDQIDLTGFIYPNNIFEVDGNGTVTEHFRLWYHYARASDAAGQNWTWVFPGRYTVYPEGKTHPRTGEAGIKLRYQGFTEPGTATRPDHGLGTHDAGTMDLTFCIPLGLPNSPGPATVNGSAPAAPLPAGVGLAYPFGGFARNGDILQVPFIGAYRVQYMGGPNPLDPSQGSLPANAPGEFAEFNAISMDSAFADDLYDGNDASEQVGRFIPLIDSGGSDDYYAWAASLLDYLTVQAPHSDYMPQMSKEAYWSLLDSIGQKPQNMTPAQEQAWRNANRPQPVSNFYAEPLPVSDPTVYANQPIEHLIGVEGLVNLNTASWRVIATLPLLPVSMHSADGNGNGVPDNVEALARSIVYHRQVHGPYETLFDLNRIPAYIHPALRPGDPDLQAPAFADAMGPWQGTHFTQAHGDLTVDPATGSPATDHLAGTFEDRYLMMNRISNHAALRSDSYTVYIVVQGWRDAGTPQAALVAERRDAYIVDRTKLTRDTRPLLIRSVAQ